MQENLADEMANERGGERERGVALIIMVGVLEEVMLSDLKNS